MGLSCARARHVSSPAGYRRQPAGQRAPRGHRQPAPRQDQRRVPPGAAAFRPRGHPRGPGRLGQAAFLRAVRAHQGGGERPAQHGLPGDVVPAPDRRVRRARRPGPARERPAGGVLQGDGPLDVGARRVQAEQPGRLPRGPDRPHGHWPLPRQHPAKAVGAVRGACRRRDRRHRAGPPRPIFLFVRVSFCAWAPLALLRFSPSSSVWDFTTVHPKASFGSTPWQGAAAARRWGRA